MKTGRKASSGNILFAVFGAVAIVGVLGAGVTSFVKGPLTGAIKQTRTNAARAQMGIGAQVAVMAAVNGMGEQAPLSEAKIFVTSTQHDAAFGGIAGGDAICQARADSAGLSGTYLTWASDASGSPSTRFQKLTVPYKRTDGVKVANNYADLTDGGLLAAIDRNEAGIAVSGRVWTGTNSDGTVAGNNNCDNWTRAYTYAEKGFCGSIGESNGTNYGWTGAGGDVGAYQMRLYCVQQTSGIAASGGTLKSGDCDADGVIEPLEFRAAGTTPAPVGGGLLPDTIGVSKKDPWGVEYGYCVWDYGSKILDSACQGSTGVSRRLSGSEKVRSEHAYWGPVAGQPDSFNVVYYRAANPDVVAAGVDPLNHYQTYGRGEGRKPYDPDYASYTSGSETPIIAIISAGPDKKFTTTCRNIATGADRADQNNNGILTDAGDRPIVGKAGPNDDDIILTYTYSQAMNAAGGLWSLKASDPTTAKTDKKIEAKNAVFSGTGYFQKLAAIGSDVLDIVSGLRLPLPAQVSTCNAASTYALRRNANSTSVEMCNGTAWIAATGGGSSLYKQPETPTPYNIVFVSSSRHLGNFGGFAGADAICQRRANAAGLPGTYKAWLSDDTAAASSRLYRSTLPYQRVDGVRVADNWTDLTDGTLAAPINKTESNAAPATNTVWSGAGASGNIGNANCAQWTSTSGNGKQGQSIHVNSNWSDIGNAACSITRHFYCFQQTAASTAAAPAPAGGTASDALTDVQTNYANGNLFAGTGTSAGTGSGTGNIGVGIEAMAVGSISGSGNNAFGYQALKANGAGEFNTAIGALALRDNQGGTMNTAAGYRALMSAGANGSENTAVGADALSTLAGSYNTGIGFLSGRGGQYNVSAGYYALSRSTGNRNTGLGALALPFPQSGASGNVAIGIDAGRNTTSGNDNVGVGNNALYMNTGSGNTAVGTLSLRTNAASVGNAAVGHAAARFTTGQYTTALGYFALYGVSGNTTAEGNTGAGSGALQAITTGADNTALGYQALMRNITGARNTAIGFQSLYAGTAANYNTAVGSYALAAATSGENAAVGANALRYLTSGQFNTALGSNAGLNVATSSGHTVIGAEAQKGAAAGTGSTALGYSALSANTGAANTAVGSQALAANTGGTENTAIGTQSLSASTTGVSNTAIGYLASAYGNPSRNTAAGYYAAYVSNGADNTAIGNNAARSAATGSNFNTALGDSSLYATTINASDITAAGRYAVYSNISGQGITGAGYRALYANLVSGSTALGAYALENNTNGSGNTAIGANALQANTVGLENTAIGNDALKAQNGTVVTAADCAGLGAARYTDSTTGHCYYNTGTTLSYADAQLSCRANGGYLAVLTSTAEINTVRNNVNRSTEWTFLGGSDAAVEGVWRWEGGDVNGQQFWSGAANGSAQNGFPTDWKTAEPNAAAGENCLGINRTDGKWYDIGCQSGYARAICEKDPATESSYNTAAGFQALQAATTGSRNTAAGYRALGGLTGGIGNTGIGFEAGNAIAAGNYNTAMGYQAGPQLGGSDNTTAIGDTAVASASNEMRIGNTGVTTIQGQVPFTATSDARAKEDIAPSDLGLDFILSLNPVSYRLKNGNGRLDYGFVAQDVERSLAARKTNMITRRDDAMRTYQLRAADILAPAVRAMAEQDAIIADLEKRVAAAKERKRLACDRSRPK